MSIRTGATTMVRVEVHRLCFDAYCRPVSCLARSAAASADLELDALLFLREVIAV